MNVSDRQKAYIQINEDAESVFSVIEEFAGVLPLMIMPHRKSSRESLASARTHSSVQSVI